MSENKRILDQIVESIVQQTQELLMQLTLDQYRAKVVELLEEGNSLDHIYYVFNVDCVARTQILDEEILKYLTDQVHQVAQKTLIEIIGTCSFDKDLKLQTEVAFQDEDSEQEKDVRTPPEGCSGQHPCCE